MNYDDIEGDIQRTKLLSSMGCLVWAIVLMVLALAPIVYFAGKFIYEMKYKETELVVSHSPNKTHTIEVVEKGEPAFFGPSLVRIKNGKHYIDPTISNDGATLYPSNVSVIWKNDKEATITLYGDEQVPEIVEFKFLNEDKNPFEIIYKELDYLPFRKSESPNRTNLIEFRRLTYSKGSTSSFDTSSPVRIYYGVKGTELTEYEELQPNELVGYDHFEIYWSGDTYVMIDVIGRNENGTTYVKGSVRIDMKEHKPP